MLHVRTIPVWVGVLCGLCLWAAPAWGSMAPAPSRGPSCSGAAEVEQEIFGMVNASRAHSGQHALLWDDRLAAIAGAHSMDMRDRDALGHVSPTTGDAQARVRRAGIVYAVVLENVARAYSAHETHFALMHSPGHRANILSPMVDRIGIGVHTRVLEDGTCELWTTEVFLRERTPYDPARTPLDAEARVEQIRQEEGFPPLEEDSVLTRLARHTAAELSAGRLRKEDVSQEVRRSFASLPYYTEFEMLLVSTADVRSMVIPELKDAEREQFGIGVAPADAKGNASAYVVLILGRATTVGDPLHKRWMFY